MQEGYLKVVKFLLEKGARVDQADVEGATPLRKASQVCLFGCSALVAYSIFCHILCYLQKGHLKVVEFLFEKGAKVDQADKYSNTPLLLASEV